MTHITSPPPYDTHHVTTAIPLTCTHTHTLHAPHIPRIPPHSPAPPGILIFALGAQEDTDGTASSILVHPGYQHLIQEEIAFVIAPANPQRKLDDSISTFFRQLPDAGDASDSDTDNDAGAHAHLLSRAPSAAAPSASLQLARSRGELGPRPGKGDPPPDHLASAVRIAGSGFGFSARKQTPAPRLVTGEGGAAADTSHYYGGAEVCARGCAERDVGRFARWKR